MSTQDAGRLSKMGDHVAQHCGIGFRDHGQLHFRKLGRCRAHVCRDLSDRVCEPLEAFRAQMQPTEQNGVALPKIAAPVTKCNHTEIVVEIDRIVGIGPRG